MHTKVTTISIPSITRLDQLELGKSLPENSVRFETDPASPDEHGELATVTAIVIVSLAALRVLAAYLMKKNKHKSVHMTVTVVKPDGTKIEKTLELADSSNEPPSAAVLKQLAELCEADVSKLVD
jgi:hypothetical protein